MGIADRIRALTVEPQRCGFDTQEPTAKQYHSVDTLMEALRAQQHTYTLMDAEWIQGIDVDCRVAGTEFRMAGAAFGDLCHFTRIPVSFIKRLCQENDTLALDVVNWAIANRLHKSGKKVLIDGEAQRIDGIVSADNYSPVRNAEVCEWVLSATPFACTGGWVDGAHMRALFLDQESPVVVEVGDIVHMGVDVWNSLNGDQACRMAEYNERLVCKNGMRRMERGRVETVIHVGDAVRHVQRACLRVGERAKSLIPLLKAAPKHILTQKEVEHMKAYLSNPKNGGSNGLTKRALDIAATEIEKKGADAVTLWDMVNGVTEASHDARSLNRRVAVESIAYNVLARYGLPVGVGA